MELPDYFRLARNVSRLSTHQRHHLGAVIVSGGRVLSVGFNQQKSHPAGRFVGRHAEVVAIQCCDHDLHGAVLYTYRERRDGTLGLARPCPDCLRIIREKGIKKIVYSTNDYPYFEIERI